MSRTPKTPAQAPGIASARPTSFAKTASPANAPFKSAPNVKTDFAQGKAPQHGSSMVKQDRPKPAPRPSHSLAHETDVASFNTRWEATRAAANRETRKAAFKAKRKKPSPKRDFNRSR